MTIEGFTTKFHLLPLVLNLNTNFIHDFTTYYNAKKNTTIIFFNRLSVHIRILQISKKMSLENHNFLYLYPVSWELSTIMPLWENISDRLGSCPESALHAASSTGSLLLAPLSCHEYKSSEVEIRSRKES